MEQVMRYWIYKTNPEKYRIEERLHDPEPEITWKVTRYADLTAAGDIAFIWMAGEQRGIVGAMKLSSAPVMMDEIPTELPYYLEPAQGSTLRVKAVLTHRIALLPSIHLRNYPELMKCAVFHGFQQATNFLLTEKEGTFILDLIEKQKAN